MLLVTLAGCGGKASTDNSGNNGGSNSGGNNTGGGAGTSVCESHDDQSPIDVNVELINKTSKTIYLGSTMTTCDVVPVFSVENQAGQTLAGRDRCSTPCQSLRQQGVGGCTAICLFPSTIELQPGATYTTYWDSLYATSASLPNTCLPYDSGEALVQCLQATRIDPGTYVFKATAGTAQDCSQSRGDGAACAPCSMAADGSCTTPGALVSGQLLEAQASVLLDEQYGYYKPIAPSSGSSDAAPGALNQATVQLIFSE